LNILDFVKIASDLSGDSSLCSQSFQKGEKYNFEFFEKLKGKEKYLILTSSS